MNLVTSKASPAAFAALLVLPGGFVDSTVATVPIQEASAGIYDPWVRVPKLAPRPTPGAQRMTREIRRVTGWSQRKVAQVLGITHPTVRALEEGRSGHRDPALFERLVQTHAVIARVHLLLGGNAVDTGRVLDTAPSNSTDTAAQLLAASRPGASLAAALDVIRPRRSAPMMTGIWPARAGEATNALTDDEPA